MKRRIGQRGGSAVEFALSTLFWVPLLLGTITVGFKLVRANQVQEVCRDTGHMYAAGVDFSQSGNQAIAVRLAQGLGITNTDGDGVLILSIIKMIGAADCTSSGYVTAGTTPNTSNCPNLNKSVFSQRLYIGNQSLRDSNFGTPSDTLRNSAGNIALTEQVSNKALQTPNFDNLLTLAPSQFAYVTEAYFSASDADGTTNTGNGVYTRSIF